MGNGDRPIKSQMEFIMNVIDYKLRTYILNPLEKYLNSNSEDNCKAGDNMLGSLADNVENKDIKDESENIESKDSSKAYKAPEESITIQVPPVNSDSDKRKSNTQT